MTSDRPYRAGIARSKAIQIINKGSGVYFDAECVRALWMLLSKNPDLGVKDRQEDKTR